MAVVTGYSTLQTALTDWLARSDLTSFTANFIQNAESKIYKRLRVREMETALSAAISSGVLALPSGYVGLKYAYVDGSPVQWLDVTDAEYIYRCYPVRSAGGKPKFMAREGANFIFGPYPDSNYTIKGIYYAKPTALRTETTNSLLTNHPDLFLYESLLESAPFIGDDPRLQTWERMARRAWRSVETDSKKESHSGGSLRSRVG